MKDKLKSLLQKSYSPYSKIQVSSILIDKNGQEWSGVNIENFSFTPTICAERTSFTKAVSEGVTKFKEIHLSSSLADQFLTPCGVCRQVMSEFCDQDFKIFMYSLNFDQPIIKTLADILPFPCNDRNEKN